MALLTVDLLEGLEKSPSDPVIPGNFLMVKSGLSNSNICKAFRNIYPQFAQRSDGGVYAQQDAEEFWTLLKQTLVNAGLEDVNDLFRGRSITR